MKIGILTAHTFSESGECGITSAVTPLLGISYFPTFFTFERTYTMRFIFFTFLIDLTIFFVAHIHTFSFINIASYFFIDSLNADRRGFCKSKFHKLLQYLIHRVVPVFVDGIGIPRVSFPQTRRQFL